MNIVEIEEDEPSQKTQGLSQRELRAKWLDTLKGKKDPV